MCNNAHTSFVRFFRNRRKYLARRNSSPDVLSYATQAAMLSPYLLSKLNMPYSVLPFHLNAYPSYLLAWMAANRMTLTCRIVIAIDLLWCSIFTRSFYLSIWFDCFATNSHHNLNSNTPLMRTLCMVAYPPCLWILSIGMILVVGGRATRWHLCDVASAIPVEEFHQPIDLAQLQFFVNGLRRVEKKSAVAMISMNAASLGWCAFLYLINTFFMFQMISCTTLFKNFWNPLLCVSSIH